MLIADENMKPYDLDGGHKADAVDIRTAFAIAWFFDEEKANEFNLHVLAKGYTYNGGWFHGMPCGRDKSWDATSKDGRKLYAVTF